MTYFVNGRLLEKEIVGRNGFSRGFWIILSIPAGAFGGFITGYYVCLGILLIFGMGHSHNDMYTVLDGGVIGLPIGAVAFPLYMYRRGRTR